MMNYYSTRDHSFKFPFEHAIYMGPAPDGGLFMPEIVPLVSKHFIETIEQNALREIAFEILRPYISMPDVDLQKILFNAFSFPAPVHNAGDGYRFLELWHGPTLAFKDFGARFMAQTMSYYRPANQEVNILVATSGDTGGAVASAFSGLEGFRVYILFPKGKVSALQQKQLTTWKSNIKSIEVNGTFDDCQKLVKTAFADKSLREHKVFGSANSINISRLLPQMIYYFEAYRQSPDKTNLSIIVPSGNFGNLTAGLLAKRMGLPIHHFIAATNANDVVPEYLLSSRYHARPSRETLSNAMDVGDPSNFVRMLDLYRGEDDRSTWNTMRRDIQQHVVSDDQTIRNIRQVWDAYGYLIDPHTAVAYEAAKERAGENHIIVSTAHWAKFIDTIKKAIGPDLPEIPQSLSDLMNKEEKFDQIGIKYDELKDIIK